MDAFRPSPSALRPPLSVCKFEIGRNIYARKKENNGCY